MAQKQLTVTPLSQGELDQIEARIGLKEAVKGPEPEKAAPAPSRHRFTIVIPAYNEEKRLAPTLEALKREFADEAEIIVVDDGSADRTSQVAASYGVKVVRLPSNKGKGAAVKSGFSSAAGRVVGFVDADNSTPALDVRRVFERAEESGAAVGTRHGEAANTKVKRAPIRKVVAWFFRKAVRVLGGVDVEDTQCGCKAVNDKLAAKIAEKLDVDGWIFDIQLLRIAKAEGVRPDEVPISWQDRSGSKITLIRDAPKMMWDLIRMRMRE
jgi:glycosyltransferase involved in cell wall biosynthesis